MARGQGVNPFGIPTNAQPMDEKGGSVTIPWRLFFTRLAQSVANLILSAVPGAPNKSIQFNDGGAFGGDAHLTWDKTNRTVTAESVTGGTEAAVRATTASSGEIDLNPVSTDDNQILLGMRQTGGNAVAVSTSAAYLFQFSGGGADLAGYEVNTGLTPGAPNPFSNGVGVQITGAGAATDPATVEGYAYGLGTGAVAGVAIVAQRNTDGAGAAGLLGGQLKDGRFFVIWMDATGAMRYNVGATLAAIRPTESGSVSDTSGFLFGSGSGTTNITQLFTRRGEEGRSGIPGLPGAPGATGSTGATGPAGANGVIISRRADEGRAGIPGINGAAGVAGATGPAGQSAPVISRRGDDGRMGNPGPTGPTGATAATTRAITFAIDGGGSVLTTGVKAEQTIPYGCTITANTVLADQSGSVALDIKKTTFAGFPGSLASIVASAPPTLSSAQKSTDSTLTGWGTTINAGDVLQWTVSSVTTVTRVNCTLTVTA